MKVQEPEDRPIAWNAVLADTPVFASDGQQVGTVIDVLGAEDIFHGIVVRTGTLSHEIMIPAEHVGAITTRRIEITATSEEIRALPAYRPEESYTLGFVGLLRKHLGWVQDSGDERQGGS